MVIDVIFAFILLMYGDFQVTLHCTWSKCSQYKLFSPALFIASYTPALAEIHGCI